MNSVISAFKTKKSASSPASTSSTSSTSTTATPSASAEPSTAQSNMSVSVDSNGLADAPKCNGHHFGPHNLLLSKQQNQQQNHHPPHPHHRHHHHHLLHNALAQSTKKKSAAVHAQDNNGYHYLRHIREIDTATKNLSPIAVADDLLLLERGGDIRNYRMPPISSLPGTSTMPAVVACVDVVDHASMLDPETTARLNVLLPSNAKAKGVAAKGGSDVAIDCNMNGGRKMTTTSAAFPMPATENGNVNDSDDMQLTVVTSPKNSPCMSPTQQQHSEDDESEHSMAACTSSSSEHSNSTVVHSPTVPESFNNKGDVASVQQKEQQQQQQPSPAKSLSLSLSSNASSSPSPSQSSISSPSAPLPPSSTSSASASSSSFFASPSPSASSAAAIVCNSGPSSCNSSTSCDVTTLAGTASAATSASPSPTLSTRSVHNDSPSPSQSSSPTPIVNSNNATAEYVPAFLTSAPITLPIIMPNGNSGLATMPPMYQPLAHPFVNGKVNGKMASVNGNGFAVGGVGGGPSAVSSAATTPKHARYSKPRLSLSRFINHSMPSVHGRPNLSIASGGGAGDGTGNSGAGGGAGTNSPKRISTHQRNLSLDFSRQNAAVENAAMEERSRVYKFPPRSGNFFGSHFIMGGERFDTPQPESYLFGENADLNFLNNRPTSFPYPPPQGNEPTKTLKSLVNIRKESVRFVRVMPEKISEKSRKSSSSDDEEQVDGNVVCTGSCGDAQSTPTLYNIEFTFDSDARCAITIYYFCTEEVSPSGVTLTSGLTSETFHYEKGINQFFSQPTHIFNPQLIPEDDLIYNPSKEQYPVAIHCVVEEGNEDCRQSHTTICVVDHHDNHSYALRALKQKIFVDGLCYLLQEIYGIENKAINKSSIDEDIDDHGSECVICMSDTRDTLILPCRHLCLCNSCADSLRYQANNCPICRAPFRALLQIRAVQKGISAHSILHQNTAGEQANSDQHVPAGYIPVSLIEALNGPPQYVARHSEGDVGDSLAPVISSDNHKATSPLKPTSQRRGKGKKNASTSTTASLEVNTTTTINQQSMSCCNHSPVDYEPPSLQVPADRQMIICSKKSPSPLEKHAPPHVENLQIVNERNRMQSKRHSSGSTITNNNNNNNSASSSHNEAEEDSDTEKLSPLLSPGSKYKHVLGAANASISSNQTTDATTTDDYDEESGLSRPTNSSSTPSSSSLKKFNRNPELNPSSAVVSDAEAVVTEDTENYACEDPHNSFLSPLCPERPKSGDRLGNLKSNTGSLKNTNNLNKKPLQKKSTSVGNIVGPGNGGGNAEMKGNVSSLPDMLDSPISGNSASTRSSSDSYSSSSSTKQLLSSNLSTAGANIIVDGDKAALQKAVNV